MEEPENQSPALPQVINSKSHLDNDDSALCHAENDSIKDEIIEALRSSTHQQDDYNEDTELSLPKVTRGTQCNTT